MTKLPPIALTAALTAALTIAGCVPMARDTSAASDAVPAAVRPTPIAPSNEPIGDNPMVGGVAMLATGTIAQNAAAAPNLTTLVAGVKAAGLLQTLSAPGPFTVFAPTNEAFDRLAPGTVGRLLEPANKASLVKVLTYHVVPGSISAAQLKAMIASGGGAATLITVEGDALTARMEGAAISLTDVNGTKSYIETPDVRQSNGIVHVVNGVVAPKLG